MNKKEYQIWEEIKYDEYLIEQHIFSFEKQLKFQGKIVLNYVVYDSDEANNTYDDLFNKNKYIKNSQININPYNNENHPIWNFYDPLLYDDNYIEACLLERDLIEDGKCFIPYENLHDAKIWH